MNPKAMPRYGPALVALALDTPRHIPKTGGHVHAQHQFGASIGTQAGKFEGTGEV
jgi:hypothetical protein